MYLLFTLGLGDLDPEGGWGKLGSAGLLAVNANQDNRRTATDTHRKDVRLISGRPR